MLKKINQRKEEGFTLIELMVVVGIIAILGGIALPIFLNQQAESAKASVRSDVRNSVTSLSTELSTNSDATTAELQSVVVNSPNNTLTVTGSGRSFTITGSANTVSSWTYVFDSVTGSYSDSNNSNPTNSPSPTSTSTPNGNGGNGGNNCGVNGTGSNGTDCTNGNNN